MRKILKKLRRCMLTKVVSCSELFFVNPEIDNKLSEAGLAAREHLESIPPEKRKSVVYFLAAHHSKFAATIDAINILALQFRGVEVYPIRASYFFRDQDVIFGGIYQQNRFKQQYKLSQEKGILLSAILQTKPLHLDAFITKNELTIASNIADQEDHCSADTFMYEGIPIGKLCQHIVANMRNLHTMQKSPNVKEEYRAHVRNCIALHYSSKRLLETVSPDAVISNVPFYYQWNIPFRNARRFEIPFYSYIIAERKNSIIWNSNSENFYGTSPAWKTFLKANFLEKYSETINNSIIARMRGDISNRSFAPDAAKAIDLLSICKTINQRPSVLFPCNVMVDAAVFNASPSFASCLEMIKDVIEWFSNHPQYCCIFKAHPGEKLFKSEHTQSEELHIKNILQQSGIRLPENVIFIDYNDEISVYSLFEFIQGVIAYNSSVCMDAGMCGLRSISCIESHYTCAGFSVTPSNRSEFFNQLVNLLTSDKSSEKTETIRLAQTYYLLYYYSASIDYGLYSGDDVGETPLKLHFKSHEALMPGANNALDYICDSILNAKPIYGDNRWPPLTA